MFDFGAAIAIASAIRIAEEIEARNKWLDALSEAEQDKIREQDKEVARQNLLHRRAIEVAEAGRPRNFWGQ